jgi:hypothetical protein
MNDRANKPNGHPMPRRPAKPNATKPLRPKGSKKDKEPKRLSPTGLPVREYKKGIYTGKGTRPRDKGLAPYVDFGLYLRDVLDKQDISITEFAGKVAGQRGGSLHPSMVSKVLNGDAPPPENAATGKRGIVDGFETKREKTWAKALGLTGKAAEKLEFQIWLARTPLPVWQKFKDMERRLAK